MNFKRFGRTANLFDKANLEGGIYLASNGNKYGSITDGVRSGVKINVLPNTQYTLSLYSNMNISIRILQWSGETYITHSPKYNVSGNVSLTITTNSTTDKIAFNVEGVNGQYAENLMLNEGSTALPYQPYMGWTNTPHYIMGTDTDTLTTLPAEIYANDTTATVGLKGNMAQASGVSPTTPIQPSECGDLETTGEHTGQYKIPISSANTTTPVYLGEVETTRKVKKLVLTGEESVTTLEIGNHIFALRGIFNSEPELLQVGGVCTHYKYNNAVLSLSANMQNGDFVLNKIVDDYSFTIKDNSLSTFTDFTGYLQQQYAAGTPVTVWYVLATPTTGIVNEPLRKIGTYADEVSGITIPTIAGANTLSIGTTLQPSEVTATYKGWHPVADVHERESGAWD